MYKNAFFCNNNNIVLGIFLSLEDKKNSLYVSVQYFFMILPVTTHPHGKGVSPHNTLLLRKKNTKTFSKIEIIFVSAILRNLQLCIVWPISICDFWNNSPVALFSPTSQKILEPESYGSISLYSNKSKRELLNNGAHCWSILF